MTTKTTDFATLSNEELIKEAVGKYVAMPNGLRDILINPEILESEGKALTPAAYKKVMVIRELSRRLLQEGAREYTSIVRGPNDAAAYLMPILRYEVKENFVALLLNTKNKIVGHRVISVGSLSASIVHPREVFKEAVKASAASIIVAYNHPSGDPTPSREDVAVTERLIKAGKIMDIPVLDHIIIGDSRYISMKERGHIK